MSALPKAPPASSPSPASSEPEWSRLVKVSLYPRLLRLPLLTLAFLHTSVVVVHVVVGLTTSTSTPLLLSPLKPTLVICTLLAFTTAILPALIVRRRLLSRRGLEKLLCSNRTPRAITLAPGQTLAANSIPAQVIHSLTQSSTWISAFLHGVLSSLFSLSLAASFALYSNTQSWWMPYHLVPSTSRTTGSFGRVISTTQVYWRPNEVFWCLVFQPFFTGLIVSLLTVCVQVSASTSIPPPRIPPFPASLVDCLAPDVSVKQSLGARITANIPRKIALAFALNAVVALVVFLLYLPIRLPLFRLYLALLPPWSSLRRLCIPTLRTGYGLTATSNLFTLLFTLLTTSAIQGATLCAAVNLWEIYATHPLGITTANLSSKPIETLLSALEIYSPKVQTAAAERNFLFTHALFDLTTLSTDTTTQGAEKRRAFFKHFAVPVGGAASTSTSTSNNGTLSAWERLSEVLMPVVKDAVRELKGEAVSAPQVKAAPASAPTQTQTPTPPAGKELQVKGGGVVGSTAVAQSKPSTTAPQPQQQQQQQTIWQRLGASQASQASTSTSTPSAPPPAQQPQQQQPPSPQRQTTLSTLLTSLPPLQTALSNLTHLSNTTLNTSTPSPLQRLTTTSPLSLILITHSILRLLPLSMQEDEWGSVTLSERRGLGVEEWCGVFKALGAALDGVCVREGEQSEDDVLALLLKAEVDGGLTRTRREFAL